MITQNYTHRRFGVFLIFLLISSPFVKIINCLEQDEDDDADEDTKIVNDEEDDALPNVNEDDDSNIVETEDDTGTAADDTLGDGSARDDATTEEGPVEIQSSSDIHSVVHFIVPPTGHGTELPAGKKASFLVGFTNKHQSKSFIVDTLECSFRYPQDFSYFIHNYTAARYSKLIPPQTQATFQYSFLVVEQLQGRPFGLTVLLNYHDDSEAPYRTAVFNETVNILEPEQGFDTEVFFLWVFLGAAVLLVLFGLYQLWLMGSKKLGVRTGGGGGGGGGLVHISGAQAAGLEMGTQMAKHGADLSWIPQETLKHHLNQKQQQQNQQQAAGSPKRSPREKSSPKPREKSSPKKGSGDGRVVRSSEGGERTTPRRRRNKQHNGGVIA